MPKNALCNYLMEQANSITDLCPKNSRWIVDVMAAKRSLEPSIVSGSVLIIVSGSVL